MSMSFSCTVKAETNRLICEDYRSSLDTLIYYKSWTYDGVGNRLSQYDSTQGGTTTYAYNANNQLTHENGPLAENWYTWDGDGNICTGLI